MGTLNIVELIVKFLKFQAFIQSASPRTLRAYGTDLQQAYGLARFGRLIGPGLSQDEEFAFILSPGSPTPLPSYNEHGLLDASRLALSQWADLAASSRNRKGACLKSFLGWAYEQHLTEKDLSSQIHPPRIPVRLPHFLSVDEILALLKTLRQTLAATAQKRGMENKEREIRQALVLVLLLYGGGLRVSEACQLPWRQVDLDRKVIRVRGKGDKERLIALPALVATELDRLERTGDYVFGTVPLNPRTAYAWVRNWGMQADLLKPLHPHALRHSYATHLLASGANLRTLQELLGHQSLQATQRYTHLGLEKLARTLEDCHPLGGNRGEKNGTDD